MSLNTKQQLANALKSLMQTKPLEKITIKDILIFCGVNRQTFYYHFKDIYDLLGWIYKTEAVGSISNCKSYETWQQGFLKIFQYVEDNKVFCMNTFHSMGRDHLEDFLHSEVFPLILNVVNEVSTECPISDEYKYFIADFYTFAFIGLLTSWMKTSMKEKPSEIIKKLEKLIHGTIKQAIHKY